MTDVPLLGLLIDGVDDHGIDPTIVDVLDPKLRPGLYDLGDNSIG